MAETTFVEAHPDQVKEALCERHERCVRKDNCVSFDNLILQIPANQHCLNYVKRKVGVRRYTNDHLAVFHGPKCLARYDATGCLLEQDKKSCPANESPLKKAS